MNIVLDLDLTLVKSSDRTKDLFKINLPLSERHRIYHFDIYLEDEIIDISGIVRPYVPEFLKFCFDYFDNVIVWSAGKREYVEMITNHIFENVGIPHAVYTYDDVEEINGNTIKPLSKILPYHEGMDYTNTLCLDDTLSTFSRNKDNGMYCIPYDPSCTKRDCMANDSSLLDLMKWFRTLDKTKDVRSIRKIWNS